MKKIIVMMMMLAPMTAFAQKFGHVDMQAVAQSMPEISKINGELEAMAKHFDNDLQAMQKEIETKYNDYQKNKSTMNASKQEETENEINAMMEKFQQARQDNTQQMQKAQDEKMKPIQDRIMKAIENVGKNGGYVYIMQTGSLPYLSTTLSTDVTNDVKNEVNKLK